MQARLKFVVRRVLIIETEPSQLAPELGAYG